MLYAIRNSEGRIVGLSETAQAGSEPVDLYHPEVRAFLSVEDENFSPDSYLDQSDQAITRIIEDLIEVLIDKNLIIFTDLPNGAQRKLLTRKLARRMIQGDSISEETSSPEDPSILSDEDDLI
jgi:hypothetical protein